MHRGFFRFHETGRCAKCCSKVSFAACHRLAPDCRLNSISLEPPPGTIAGDRLPCLAHHLANALYGIPAPLMPPPRLSHPPSWPSPPLLFSWCFQRLFPASATNNRSPLL